LEAIAGGTSFPFAKERALAEALLAHVDPVVRAWAEARLPRAEPPPPPPPDVRALTLAEADAIAIAHGLGAAQLAPALRAPSVGLAAALARRPRNTPSALACAALLASHDPIAAMNLELARVAPLDWIDVERAMVAHWLRNPHLGLLGHAVLHRWE